LKIILNLFKRSRSRSRDSSKPSSSRVKYSEKPNISEADLEGKSPEEIEMMKTMGFCGFETTKGKKVHQEY
jgi:U4/U6.U5 tri-snRNP-associated protein 3